MSDKTIVFVTGANCGIGYDTVEAIASTSPSYHVILGSRSIQNGETALKELQALKTPSTISLQQIDLNSDDSISAAAAAIEKEFGRVDVLINNAGACSRAESYAQRLREDINVNAIGTALVTEAFTELVVKSKEKRIIYISSTLGSVGLRMGKNGEHSPVDYATYRVSKSALNMIAMCDYVKLKEQGVKAQLICPGYVMSNLSGKTEEAWKFRADTGAGDSAVSAQTILSAVEGKKEEYVGGFFNKEGRVEW